MVVVVFLIVIGLLPPLLSVWVTYRAERGIVDRFGLAVESAHYPAVNPWRQRHPDERYVDGMGLVIGDITCQLNARSPYIRCAVNPTGPCEECRFYEGRTYKRLDGV